jgi:regulation of enolase protein 1 (concanavalin A-like superfamily)
VTEPLVVPGVTLPLTASPGSTWRVASETRTVSVTAARKSDIFIDPGNVDPVNAQTLLNASTLMGELPPGDFQFSGRVAVDFVSTFDAGVLLLWLDERHWGKLCFEFSPDGEPMVVSVVARGVADDANAFVVRGGFVWLRVSRVGTVYAYHASTDGSRWQLVRVFALAQEGAAASIGLEAQSPTGDGCEVVFSELAFAATTLSNLRDGS